MPDRRKLLVGAVVVALVVGAGGYAARDALDDDGGGDDRAATEQEALSLPPGTIVAVDFEYPVDEVTVAAGDPLTFENRGSANHTPRP